MNLLHVSTERFYGSAILVAVLFLAIPEGYFCFWKPPIAYTFGRQEPGDSKTTRHINLARSTIGRVMYKTTLNMKWEIHFIRFLDHARNGPDIWMSQYPPCYNPEIRIQAPPGGEIDVQMEIYVTLPKKNG